MQVKFGAFAFKQSTKYLRYSRILSRVSFFARSQKLQLK